MRLVKFLSAVLSVIIGWVRRSKQESIIDKLLATPEGRQKLVAGMSESKEPSVRESENWTVELEPGCWLATWTGDPGRTLVEDSAKGFDTRAGAVAALGQARRHRPFAHAEIRPPTTGDAAEALGTLVRAGLIHPDGTPTPFYDPNNTDCDHMPHAFGSWNPDDPDTNPDTVSG